MKTGNILTAIALMGTGALAQYGYTASRYALLDEVEFANYQTLDYKIECIKAQGELINDLMATKGAQNYVQEAELESYIKVSYLDYLERCETPVSYSDYRTDFWDDF